MNHIVELQYPESKDRSMTNGLFICFEGGEGSGKSTQLKLLKRKLERYGILPVSIREPGGTGFGDKLREILMFSKEELTPEAELLLFNASRSQLVYKVISPALHEGKLVLCDRFSASTLAYQGYGRGISLKKVEGANNIATNGLAPSSWICLQKKDLIDCHLDEIDLKCKELRNFTRELDLDIWH